jgi:UDP-N-acetyl-L-fucosamine synthase
MKIKVITTVGTRPEIIRLSAVIEKLNNSPSIDHILIHTGQNYDYELNEIFFEDLGLKTPDIYLQAVGKSQMETIGNILSKIDVVLADEKPDAFLVLGDTNSCLCAIAAKKRKIPVFHMEAGNRCYDMRVPEELNRRIVDHVSDINLTYSDIARQYLISEGIPAERIIRTGSPMYEVLYKHLSKIKNSKVLKDLRLDENNYFVVSAHRAENVDSNNFKGFLQALNSIAETYLLPIIFSTHPRTKAVLEKLNFTLNPLIKTLKPLSFSDYNSLQKNARAVLSDSGTISEESSILNFRALNIRESHERPEAMEETSVILTGLDSDKILNALNELLLQSNDKRDFNLVKDYSYPNVSDKVIRIILSYEHLVRRKVWNEYN